jgi:predicted MFS family arabinose efflux permease
MSTRPLPPATLAWSVWGLGALLYLIGFYQRVAPAVIGDRLMAEFAISGAALGNLSAFYFYSYVLMQVPTGVLADRWGARKLLTTGAALAAVGTMVFAFSPDLAWASFGRLMIGGSVAVAFVSMLKLATHWFAPKQFALASGMALFVGIVGGVFGGVPLRMLVDNFGWRPVMMVSAAVTAVLAIAIWLRVRDDPADRDYRSHHPRRSHAGAHGSILGGVARVFAYRNVWILLISPIGVSGAVLTFGGLWGVPYLRQVYGLDPRTAAAITSAVLVAWAIGGPLMGTLSERIGQRKPLHVAGCAVALACWSLLAFVHLSLPALIGVLLVAGFAAGNLIIGFAFNKESVPVHLAGTASGVCNMGPLMGGMLLQPAFGWVLDRYWQGVLEAGVRSYPPEAFRAGFLLIAACIASSLVLSLFSRETGCRQHVD